MKLWKIGLYICCILIILYWFFCRMEGFQASMTTPNVPYTNYEEVYLVIPNIPGTAVDPYSESLNPDGTGNPAYYGTGSYASMADAAAICTKSGATLATHDQLATAAWLEGFWGVASWATDGNKYLLVPEYAEPLFRNTLNKTTGDSAVAIRGTDSKTHNPLRIITTSKAYPVCWGVKPPNPTTDIAMFNETDYSMFTANLLSSVMNPQSTDLLQVSFTADQAIYALVHNGYKASDARALLVSNLEGSQRVNDNIYKEAVGTDQYTQETEDLQKGACEILKNTYNKFYQQYSQTRDILHDISGGVIAMERAKDENARFQMKIEAICAIETPTTSPACSKLATLDYELLYSTSGSDLSTSRLAKLELLNNTLFQRQQELCMAMDNLFNFKNIIGCPSDLFNGTLPRCVYNSLGSGSDSGSAYMLNELQTNDEAYLRLKLKQISPYFNVSTYTKLMEAINSLAYIIDIPTLNDFKTSDQNFTAVSNGVKTIKSFIANM